MWGTRVSRVDGEQDGRDRDVASPQTTTRPGNHAGIRRLSYRRWRQYVAKIIARRLHIVTGIKVAGTLHSVCRPPSATSAKDHNTRERVPCQDAGK
jgi:hypothetical protein